jgi:hypothetical protein
MFIYLFSNKKSNQRVITLTRSVKIKDEGGGI